MSSKMSSSESLEVTDNRADNSDEDLDRLRARIEQQSELISLMKKRSDGLIKELEVVYSSLDKERETKGCLEQELTRKNQQLQEKDKQLYSALAQRDKSLLDVKSLEDLLASAKHQAQCITKEKDALMTERSTNHSKVLDLESKLLTIKEQNRSFEDCIKSLQSNLNDKTTSHNDTLMHVSKLKKENEDMKSHYDQIIRKLTRDKEEAATLYSELKEQLKTISLESKKWQQQAASFEKTMRDSTADMKHGSRSQAENELIANLKRELVLTEGKLVSLDKEFSMFKKHSKDQLEHERQLNSKLRHLAL